LESTQEIVVDIEITPELYPDEGLLTQDESTENYKGEGRINQIRLNMILPLIVLTIFALLVLAFLWLRRSGTRG
jgi:hypothetical protein